MRTDRALTFEPMGVHDDHESTISEDRRSDNFAFTRAAGGCANGVTNLSLFSEKAPHRSVASPRRTHTHQDQQNARKRPKPMAQKP
jgi:hypothetical protein